MFFGSFSWSFVYISLPFHIHRISTWDAAATLTWTGWIMGITPLATVVTAPVWGRWAERGNPKTLYTVVQVTQGLAFLGTAAARTLIELFLCRIVLGVTGAASTFAFVSAGRSDDPRNDGPRVAAIQSGMPIGQVIGPLVGAIAAARLGFRASFVLGAAILFGCGALVRWGLPDRNDGAASGACAARPNWRDVFAVAGIVLGGSTQIFFLTSILPRVLSDLGVADDRTLEVGGLVIFASAVAAALGSVLAARLAELVPERRLIPGLLVLSSIFVDALAEGRSVWVFGALATRGGVPPGLGGISVHVRYGEFFTFLGPPHSGKTDVLRAVAGFMTPTAGRVVVDGQDLGGLAPAARSIGYVFQEGALWRHMSVREHIAFGLEQQRLSAGDVQRRVETVLTRLGLADVPDGRPPELTLEQRRRLALARALAPEPRVLLLDEPLAHLDPLTRKTLRIELAKLHRDLAVTTIHATRDAADALALSDRLAVLSDGQVAQLGEPSEVYQHPRTRVVAEALGPANFLPVRVVEVRDLGVVVETEAGHRVPVAGVGEYREGGRGLLVLRPELLSMTDAAMGRGPGLPGTVSLRVFEGARQLYEVDIGAVTPVRVELPSQHEGRIFRLGERVRVELSSETVVLVPDASRA